MTSRSLLQSLPESARFLTFSPLAWLKLQFFCHAGDTEVGGFGISSAQDLLHVEDFITVRQQVTPVTVRFDDAAVADYFDGCVDQGLAPCRFGRIWLHTHPGASVIPSGTDEETFARVFGACDWALMFILGRTGQTYARLAFSAGPGGEMLLPVRVDWSAWPATVSGYVSPLATPSEQWRQEYAAHVQVVPDVFDPPVRLAPTDPFWNDDRLDSGLCWADWNDDFDPFTEEDSHHEPALTRPHAGPRPAATRDHSAREPG